MGSSRRAKKHRKRRRSREHRSSADRAAAKLRKYASRGRTSKVRGLLDRLPEPKSDVVVGGADERGRTALHLACHNGYADVAALLVQAGCSLSARDDRGRTPLHAAANAEHWQLLLGLLQSEPPPDVEIADKSGVTVRQMVEAYTAKQQQHPASKRYELIADDNEDDGVSEEQRTARRHSKRRCTSSSSRSSAGSSSSSGGSSRSRSVGGEEDDEDAAFAARVRAANAAAKAARGNLDDAAWEWQQRLQEEAAWDSGDGAFGAGGLAAADLRAASSVEEGEFWPGERAEEEVDLWADRIWQGMQARRRQQAAESSRAFGAAMRRDAERAAAEAAARSRSEKILQDEQAKDAAWRQRVVGLLPAPQAVVDVGRQREVYEAKWAALDALLMPPPPPPSAAAARRTLTTADLPWPPVLASATGAEVSTISRQAAIGPALPGSAGVREQLQQPELGTPAALDAYRTVVLLGVQGAADIKKRLRSEILRWHPDKWVAKYGALLPAASAGGTAAALLRDRLLAHVRGMSQMVTQLMSAPAV